MTKSNLTGRSKAKRKKITPKTDFFLSGGIEYIDYKDVSILQKFVNPQGRIKSYTQLKAKTQRKVAISIKRARQMGLLRYTIVEQNE